MTFPHILILFVLALASSALSATPFLDLSLPSDTYRDMTIPGFENRHIEEHSEKHHIHVSYPQTGYPRLDEVISEFVADEINNFKKFEYAGDKPNYPHELSINFKTPTQRKGIISLIAGISKRTSGASPNYDLKIFNFQTSKGRMIRQDKVFEITGMTEVQLKAELKMATSANFTYGHWESVHESIQNNPLPPFSVEVVGIRFWYLPYTIAPGAFGIIDVILPWKQFSDGDSPATNRKEKSCRDI